MGEGCYSAVWRQEGYSSAVKSAALSRLTCQKDAAYPKYVHSIKIW
jgi:hypothetical protein